MRPIRAEASQATQFLVGATVVEVNVKTGYGEFVFLGDEMRVIVRITKEFSFVVQSNQSRSFDPNFVVDAPPVSGSGDFVFLRGTRCDSATLTESGLSISLAAGSSIVVALSTSDFEPIELIGSGGERFEDLAFYHVL
jgi:hypothetical protein